MAAVFLSALNAFGISNVIEPLAAFAEPAISPDRAEIAFVSGGDIWTVPASGGEARLLVSHAANDSRPVYSPDGKKLAFVSNRTGNGDIYLLTLETGELRQLTFDDQPDQLEAFSRDGRWIYFSSTSREVAGGMNDIFRVGIDGGTPMQISADPYTSEYQSAPAPDGKTLAFTSRGINQWWRKGSSHIDETEIWLMRDVGANSPVYEKIVERGARQNWAMWNADGTRLFYVSDRGGAQNIWSQVLGKPAQQMTKFKDGRVLFANISYDGRTIVFEREMRIWRLDTGSGQTSEVAVVRRGVASSPAVEHVRLSDQIQELALSPDGKKVAFVVRGEIFAASAKDGGDAARVSNSFANESGINWSPDNRRLVYASDRDGNSHLFVYDFSTNQESRLTDGSTDNFTPVFSPDGKMIAFERDGRELRVLNLDTKQERVLTTGTIPRPPINADRPFVWSPDSRWIAMMTTGNKLFTNIQIVSAAGDKPAQAASFLANAGSNTVSWSPDGTFVLFDTGQRTENFNVARIDLIPRTPRFREDQFRELFREETPRNLTPSRPSTDPPASPTPAASPTPLTTASPEERKSSAKTVEIVFEDIRKRLNLLPVGVDVNYQTISPDGKWLLMIASAANQENLYIYSLDELSREPAVARQLTSTPGNKSAAQFSPDSKEVFYLEQGRINVVPLDTRVPRPLAVAAEMDIDFAREKQTIFNQAWTLMRDQFYDPNFHGVNWNEMRGKYEPFVIGARTPDEMRRIISLMIGELNASHLGISAPGGNVVTNSGKIGVRWNRAEYEKSGRLQISEVIPLSPAAISGKIKNGDYILAVDGKDADSKTNFDELLNYKINRRVVLSVADSADGANKREVIVRPVNTQTERGLNYRKWVENNRAYVARASNGRLGYVHMPDMSANSLAQLYLDLDAENQSREGVVIDIRNNNGGFVNVYAIDVFARRGYLNMQPRGFGVAPARAVLGQRSLEAPTILLTNQHSLSDAEDFAEGYRTLKLGKIVGEPTAGWIIYTWNVGLMDGSTFRLPRMKITANDGQNMELNPRPVDIPVMKQQGESYQGRDSQLDRAVAELLKQIETRAQR